MKRKLQHIHRGELLQKVVKEKGISITTLTKRLGYKNRASYYSHIIKPDLSFEILFKYGKVLQYDFADDISDMPNMANEPPVNYEKKPINLEQALKLIEELKDSHYKLLLKYQALLEKMEELSIRKR